MSQDLAIGVFDSGVGGLRVVRALRTLLPNESFLYLGDTARLPYGTKSPRTVQQYSRQAVARLVERRIKMLVVACNTVSALTLDVLREEFAPLPVLGVIEPAAAAALLCGQAKKHLVLATEGTVARGAYAVEIRKHDSSAIVEEIACTLFVALAEEGRVQGAIVDAITDDYLGSALSRSERRQPDSVILGCTHFALFESTIRRSLGSGFRLVDSASTAAGVTQQELERLALGATKSGGNTTFLVTDHPDRFARVGAAFLGEALPKASIEWIDL